MCDIHKISDSKTSFNYLYLFIIIAYNNIDMTNDVFEE